MCTQAIKQEECVLISYSFWCEASICFHLFFSENKSNAITSSQNDDNRVLGLSQPYQTKPKCIEWVFFHERKTFLRRLMIFQPTQLSSESSQPPNAYSRRCLQSLICSYLVLVSYISCVCSDIYEGRDKWWINAKIFQMYNK